jgi:iron complex transport system permease protein
MTAEGTTERKYFKRFRFWKLSILLLVIILFLTVTFVLTIGPMNISAYEIVQMFIHKIPGANYLDKINISAINETIVIQVRLPRIIGGVLVGAALAVAGVVLQALLRNPIADPYVIGISAGASLGASLAVGLGIGVTSIGLLYSLPILAFIMGLVTVFVVYLISKSAQGIQMVNMLLVGVAVNSLLLAVVAIMRVYSGEGMNVIMSWLFGSLANLSWVHIEIAFPFIIFGLAGIYFFSKDLNLMLLGEEQAAHLGLDSEKTKKLLLVLATLITAGAVSISGIIGFIGLIVPLTMRILVGPDHRILIPSSTLLGAIVLVVCDTISRSIVRPTELPVGIFTSIIGCPFFIYLLKGKSGRKVWTTQQ